MMGVRDCPQDREEDNTSSSAQTTNWVGRCLEDRFEILSLIAETDLVATHHAKTVDGDKELVATIYKRLQVDGAHP